MALKILGWGTMVGVAFLAITSLKTWMAPLTAKAAQMVRFVEPLACPNGPQPSASPRDCPRVPALHPFPVVVASQPVALQRPKLPAGPYARAEN